MLVLTRKVNETVYVGNDIVISVVKIDRNKVRLGIAAPPDVDIRRTEIVGKTNKIPSVHQNNNKRKTQ